jgi:hypothetical protein
MRCFGEGALRSVADANIGFLLNVGLLVWTVGVIQHINPQERALTGFAACASELVEGALPVPDIPRWAAVLAVPFRAAFWLHLAESHL